MNPYSFTINSDPLTTTEKQALKGQLDLLGLHHTIWNLYDNFLLTATKNSIPLILRMQSGDDLVAVVILIKCYDYGSTLTGFKPAVQLMKMLRLPVYVWMKSGIAAELLANPGFINDKYDPGEIFPLLLEFLRKELLLSFILDLEENEYLHSMSTKLPYPDEGIIDMDDVENYDNYRKLHGNIKKKIRHYKSKGGVIDVVKGKMQDDDIQWVGQCIASTSKHSVFKLPYQENYSAMCMASASIEDENVVHFICRTVTDFLGYHSFIDFGTHLRCLNGAFNRELKTTHHAYENMITRVVEYAENNGIKRIFFGPVLNETKRRMMHEFQPTTLHFSSNKLLLNAAFPVLLRNSKMVNKKILSFRTHV